MDLLVILEVLLSGRFVKFGVLLIVKARVEQYVHVDGSVAMVGYVEDVGKKYVEVVE